MSAKKKEPVILPDPLPKFLEVPEVAALLRLKPRTIYDWVSQKRIPFRKFGDRTMFDRDEILKWAEEQAA
jgi:excisionase family DNA binding protein